MKSTMGQSYFECYIWVVGRHRKNESAVDQSDVEHSSSDATNWEFHQYRLEYKLDGQFGGTA